MSGVTQEKLYNSINDFRKEVNERFDKLEKQYVTRAEFEPVQRVVNWSMGVGGLVLIGILALILSHVIPGFDL